MSIFTLPTGIDLDSYDEYESGAIDQRDRCEHQARVIAFGAIRRAAAEARAYDDQATASVWISPATVGHHMAAAHAIRAAIRAAIGSNKA